MKLFLLTLSLALPTEVFAETYLAYKTRCWARLNTSISSDVCTVKESRSAQGSLQTRSVFSNKFSITVKSWFDPLKGFMTWDSQTNQEYPWSYKVGSHGSFVSPHLQVENIPWD